MTPHHIYEEILKLLIILGLVCPGSLSNGKRSVDPMAGFHALMREYPLLGANPGFRNPNFKNFYQWNPITYGKLLPSDDDIWSSSSHSALKTYPQAHWFQGNGNLPRYPSLVPLGRRPLWPRPHLPHHTGVQVPIGGPISPNPLWPRHTGVQVPIGHPSPINPKPLWPRHTGVQVPLIPHPEPVQPVHHQPLLPPQPEPEPVSPHWPNIPPPKVTEHCRQIKPGERVQFLTKFAADPPDVVTVSMDDLLYRWTDIQNQLGYGTVGK